MGGLSIQSRLLALVLGAVLLAGLVTGWLGYRRAVHEADEVLDAQLAQYAQIMLALGHGHDGDDDEVAMPELNANRYQNKVLFQIWHQDEGETRLMLRSRGAPHLWPAGVATEGYSVAPLDGKHWRFFAVLDRADHLRVLAAHDLGIRDGLAREIALSNLKPYALALPLLALVLIVAIRRGLVPLRRLADDLSGRDPDQLAPLAESGLPGELRPPVRAMNGLFDRIRTAMESERRFTSDAAHELRTPLAALRAQLQVAERTPDNEERLGAIAKAKRGTDRMNHLVDQLLAMARLEGMGEGMAALDLSQLVSEQAGEMARDAGGKGLRFKLECAPDLGLTGNAGLLRALLRNLLDNAIRYTPAGGRIEVDLAAEGEAIVLRVADDGPGVPPEARDNLGRRFNRFGPRSEEGVGLGLSIVARIATLHGARLAYGDGLDGRGLGITLVFPGSAPPRQAGSSTGR